LGRKGWIMRLRMVMACGLLACVAAAGAKRYEPRWESLDTRPMPAWFNEAKFGIFVVWGPYCVPGWKDRGYAEWYGNRMRREGSPTWKFHRRVYGADYPYERFAEQFKAELWDPEAWVDLFVRAGARYVVTTANYHDGFCLYPTQYDATTRTDRWNSTEVGPMRDILGELNAAGRKRGLKMGIYYSLYEWYHPLWLADRDRYVTEKFHPQFKEVVTRYKPPVIFLDGEWEMDYKRWRSEELCAWLFNDSPVADEVVVNDRWGKCRGQHGSFYESEYGGGRGWMDHPWQEDRGIGHSYGYNRNETVDDYDSRDELIRMLSRVVGNGGNYLLAVGPTPDGRIPVIMQERLVQIGRWLAIHGEAIYGSQGSPYRPWQPSWGTCTVKDGRLYVHLWETKRQKVTLPGLKNRVTACRLLTADGPRALPFTQGAGEVTITIPSRLWLDPAVAIIALDLEGERIEIDRCVRQQADGSLKVAAAYAEIHGRTPRYEPPGKDQIGYWQNAADWVSWPVQIDRPGEFEVEVVYSYAGGDPGSAFEVRIGAAAVTGRTTSTGAWDRHRRDRIGSIRVVKPGRYALSVHPVEPPKWRSMGLREVRLVAKKSASGD